MILQPLECLSIANNQKNQSDCHGEEHTETETAAQDASNSMDLLSLRTLDDPASPLTLRERRAQDRVRSLKHSADPLAHVVAVAEVGRLHAGSLLRLAATLVSHFLLISYP